MFNPDLQGVLKNHLSRYSLVVATAKRAREIADEAEENKEIITDSDHVILTYLQSETVANRLNDDSDDLEDEEDEE